MVHRILWNFGKAKLIRKHNFTLVNTQARMLVQNGMCAKKINKNVTPTSHPCQKIERLNPKKNHFQGTPTPTVLIRAYFESKSHDLPYMISTTYQKHPANN